MTCKQQARTIYVLCATRARSKETLTYREVLSSLGYKKGVSGQAIRYGLELVWIACANLGLPILTSIVINQLTRRPSDGVYPDELWEEEAERVFNHGEWPDVDEIDWKYIWDNRRLLSDEYGTRGYWSR